jgi:hypothetical protein
MLESRSKPAAPAPINVPVLVMWLNARTSLFAAAGSLDRLFIDNIGFDGASAGDQVVHVRQRIEPPDAVVAGVRKKEISATFERGIPEEINEGATSAEQLDRVVIVQHTTEIESRTRLDIDDAEVCARCRALDRLETGRVGDVESRIGAQADA